MRRKLASLAIFSMGFIFCLVALSCGLETLSFLSVDPVVISNSTTQLIFSGADTADDRYYGVQLFYKIYATESDATTDRSYVISKQSATNVVPGSVVESYLLPSSGLGYQCPILNGTVNIPSIPKSYLMNSNYYVSIDFPPSGEPSMTIRNGDNGSSGMGYYSLKRSVMSTAGTAYLSFLDEPITGNADFRSRATDTDNVYYVQFFAASYGMDPDKSFSEMYGDAVFLGSLITLNF